MDFEKVIVKSQIAQQNNTTKNKYGNNNEHHMELPKITAVYYLKRIMFVKMHSTIMQLPTT